MILQWVYGGSIVPPLCLRYASVVTLIPERRNIGGGMEVQGNNPIKPFMNTI